MNLIVLDPSNHQRIALLSNLASFIIYPIAFFTCGFSFIRATYVASYYVTWR